MLHLVPSIVVSVVAAVAAAIDLRTRRIPNVLTFGSAILAVAYHGASGGWSAAAWSVGGWLMGLLLFLPLFTLRGMGAGDVKLLAALGAWLGPGLVVWVAVWSSLAGGVLGIAVALAHRSLGRIIRNLVALLGYWRLAGIRPLPTVTLQSGVGPRLAYAVPILIGTMVTLWRR